MSDDNNPIDIQYAITPEGVPAGEQLRQWAQLALAGRADNAELSVRVVDEAEITALNHEYRGKDYPTNVLAFGYGGTTPACHPTRGSPSWPEARWSATRWAASRRRRAPEHPPAHPSAR